MISSDKGNFKILGEYKDVVFELNVILEYFTNNAPEVLGGALAVWGDKLKTALSTGDTDIEVLDYTRELTEHYTRMREALGDE